MTDYTHEITALQRARIDMQAEKANTRTTIKAKYAERIRQEIEDANQAAELHFAKLLAEAHEAGVPQSLLRSEVLRTNVWSRWVYWRDLAEIQPDRVMFEDAKKARELENATFLWSEDYAILTVKRNSLGHVLPEPVTYNMANLKKRDKKWNPIPDDEELYISTIHADEPYAFGKMVNAEIQRQIDAGHVRPNEGNL